MVGAINREQRRAAIRQANEAALARLEAAQDAALKAQEARNNAPLAKQDEFVADEPEKITRSTKEPFAVEIQAGLLDAFMALFSAMNIGNPISTIDKKEPPPNNPEDSEYKGLKQTITQRLVRESGGEINAMA